VTDKELIYLFSFRYALGRKTYAVSTVCDWLKSHKKELSKQAKELIIKEIEEAEEEDKRMGAKGGFFKTLGDDCDKKRWLELKKVLGER